MPRPVGLLVSAGVLLDAFAVLADPRGNLPLAWGLGALLMGAAWLWPRDAASGARG